MPPRPFPYALNIGTDIVHVPRIRAIITDGDGEARKKNLQSLMRRLLTPREEELFWRKYKGPSFAVGATHLESTAKFLAGRWAAKEAVIKAVTYRRLSLWDVQILSLWPSAQSSPVYALILDQLPNGASRYVYAPYRKYDVTAILQSDVTDILQHDSPQRDGSAAEIPDDDPDSDAQVAKVNISHDGDYATAVCLAVDLPRDGDVGGEAAAREP